MAIGARAVEDGMTDIGVRGTPPAAPAERLIGLFHGVKYKEMPTPRAGLGRPFGMPLIDSAMTDERPAGCRRTCHRLRKVIRSCIAARQVFRPAGFDMRVRRAGAARSRERKLARYSLRMLERGRRF